MWMERMTVSLHALSRLIKNRSELGFVRCERLIGFDNLVGRKSEAGNRVAKAEVTVAQKPNQAATGGVLFCTSKKEQDNSFNQCLCSQKTNIKMGKKIILGIVLLLFVLGSKAQTTDTKIYDPSANAETDIAAAVKKAKAENKHVLLQAGGNWCSWCIEFNKFTQTNGSIDSLLNKCFVVYHLNYSKENENKAVFAKYGYPQRFGFPVFIILDENGNRLHTQNSEYLEQGRSYNKQKVFEFLLQWTPQALDASLYK